MSTKFFAQIDALTEAGKLRRLSGVFARFIATLGATPADTSPQLMLACVLLSELEGRGHSCLLLSELNADPAALLGWSGDEWRDLRATVACAGHNAPAAEPVTRGGDATA
ncbi:exodeoxyribonuclease V subunit alpha, partial [Duganella callida]